MWRCSSCRLIAGRFTDTWTPSQVFFNTILSPSPNKEEAISEFKNTETRIKCYQNQQYHTVLISSFNAKIGSDKKGTQKYDLTVVNESICCGKWARISATNQNQKPILVYVICLNPLKYYIQEMIVDEEENYKLKGKNQ